MLELQDCIKKLSDFKGAFAHKFGITKLGIFGSVARKENTENSDIDIVVEEIGRASCRSLLYS